MARIEQGLGHDPDRVREVDDPGVPRRPAADVIGQLEDDGYRAQGLREAAGAGRLLADTAEPERCRLVAQAGRLAADPELDHDEVRAVDRGVAVGGGHEPAAPAAVVEHPAGETADDVQPLRVDIEQGELVHAEALLAGGETFHELGGVRAAASDDGDLHAHRLPARSARRSSTARPPSRLPCWTGALTPRRPRTILLITIAATNVRSTTGVRRCGHWR